MLAIDICGNSNIPGNMSTLSERAKQLRRETLQLAIDTNNEHVAPAFSMIELLIAVYDHMGDDDKFILS